MPGYVPHTSAERDTLLASLGLHSTDQLFTDIPQALQEFTLNLPEPLTELELQQELGILAQRNLAITQQPCFLGAGAYRHFVPSVLGHIMGRSEFATAYTPYQPEISQGTLQAAFEFQTMMCYLTGMEVANTGMYDGPTALAEAALMACRVTGREKVAALATVNPRWRAVTDTYCTGQNIALETQQPESLSLDESYACIIVQNPDFFGNFRELEEYAEAAHQVGALLVVASGLTPLGMLKPPGAFGADIVVAEGQELGQPTIFGGPYVGAFCCREQFVRQMPGRIVGRTADAQGRTGYVLTLQTREQHIRRERATSNICTKRGAHCPWRGGLPGRAWPPRSERVGDALLSQGALSSRPHCDVARLPLTKRCPFLLRVHRALPHGSPRGESQAAGRRHHRRAGCERPGGARPAALLHRAEPQGGDGPLSGGAGKDHRLTNG